MSIDEVHFGLRRFDGNGVDVKFLRGPAFARPERYEQRGGFRRVQRAPRTFGVDVLVARNAL
jgi:hypothetical protein